MKKFTPMPAKKAKALVGWGISHRYTKLCRSLAPEKILKQSWAVECSGFVNRYNSPRVKKGKIFSISFWWARLTLSTSSSMPTPILSWGLWAPSSREIKFPFLNLCLAVKNDLVSVLTAIRPAWKAKAPKSSELTFIFHQFSLVEVNQAILAWSF